MSTTALYHADISLFFVVPGEVGNPICPNLPDDGILNIHWSQPSVNADSVVDYVVEVVEYSHQSGSRTLKVSPLIPPFRQEEKSGEELTMAVTSGVSKWDMQ
jgi:hypothetical protein